MLKKIEVDVLLRANINLIFQKIVIIFMKILIIGQGIAISREKSANFHFQSHEKTRL